VVWEDFAGSLPIFAGVWDLFLGTLSEAFWPVLFLMNRMTRRMTRDEGL
jgi:hypothetical protein